MLTLWRNARVATCDPQAHVFDEGAVVTDGGTITWVGDERDLPSALRPVTLDQIRLLQKDNVVSGKAIEDGRTLEGLGVTHPHSVASIVPEYLERFNPKGQYASYRG